MARPHTHTPERHSFVFLKFSGTTTQNLTARTTIKLCFGGLSAKYFTGEICLAKFAGEIRRNISRKYFDKAKCDSRRKPAPQKITCKLHRSQNVPSREQVRSRDSVCSRSADSSAKQEARRGVPKLGFSVLFAVNCTIALDGACVFYAFSYASLSFTVRFC